MNGGKRKTNHTRKNEKKIKLNKRKKLIEDVKFLKEK
jgi:hypothetical protein